MPDSVTRTVIYAVNPIQINSLSIASSSGDNFANAGRTITVTLDAESNDLGNFTTLLGREFTSTTNGGKRVIGIGNIAICYVEGASSRICHVN